MTIIWRAWVGFTGYPIPAFAYPASAQLDPHLFSAEMGYCPEWGILAQNRKPQRSNITVRGFFEGSCGQAGGQLNPKKSGFTIDPSDLTTAEFMAYTRQGQQTSAVRVLTAGELDGQPRTILLKPGGSFESTPDLDMASLECMVTYPSCVEASEEAVGSDLFLYVAGKDDEGPCIMIYRDCSITSLRDRKLVLALGSMERTAIAV